MIRLLVKILELSLKFFYHGRVYPHFFVLETVARVPYFAFLSVLHFYESMGDSQKSDWIKVHFAESRNEFQHLLIIESLGGNQYWIDRWVARIGAFIYYWILVFAYMLAPSSVYHFTELVEEQAYQTYDKFLKKSETELKAQPAPEVAIHYYESRDLYVFAEPEESQVTGESRPKINNLYDVFVAIRDDEKEHLKTMVACQQPETALQFRSF